MKGTILALNAQACKGAILALRSHSASVSDTMKLQGHSHTPSVPTDHHERCGWEWSHEPRLLVLTLTRFMLRKPFSQKYAVNAISHKGDHYVVAIKYTQLSIRKSLLGHWPQWANGYIIYLRVHQYSFLLGVSSFFSDFFI